MASDQRPLSCPVCVGTRVTDAFSIGPYGLSRCAGCDHLFVSRGVQPQELDSAYDESYYSAGDAAQPKGYRDYLADADTRLRGFAQRLKLLTKITGRDRGRLLDFGCAVGLFVKVAADAGWDAWGYERSKWAASYGRQTYGVRIIEPDGSGTLPFDQPFDLVTIWDALEHLEDPRSVLTDVSRVLRPGGVVALNTVNASSWGARLAGQQWRHLAPPHHLQFFSLRSLHQLLAACGMRIIRTEVSGVMLQARRTTSTPTPLARWTETLVTSWRMHTISRALNLLDEVHVVAVKE